MTPERRKLLSAARRLLLRRPDAEDAVQEAYLRALSACPGPAVSPAWLYTVTRHIAVDQLRRRRLEAGREYRAEGAQDSAETLVETASDGKSALRFLLSRVSAAEAAALLLREVFEFGHDEIGNMLGKSEAATRQFLHRTRARLQRRGLAAESDPAEVGLFWRCIEMRDPGRLIEMLQPTTTQARLGARDVRPSDAARSTSLLVQVNGRYALALVLDGVVLCVVPAGTAASLNEETAA